jgi:hypothetical protein
VIYKAVADFGDLMKDAAQAKAALQAMADAAKSESAASAAGSIKAAQARAQESASITQQAAALSQLGNAAKNTNVQLLYGGRNDIQQHLSDMAQALNYTNLMNRAQWMGFSSVQQAMSYRQQMYNQKLLENRAEFAGYQTADQYLSYMQRRTTSATSEAAAIRARAMAIQDETTALLTYDNALQGTHSTLGQLGEGGSTVSALNAALTDLPDEVVTKISIDDGGALGSLQTYKAALRSVPATESTSLAAITAGKPSYLSGGSTASYLNAGATASYLAPQQFPTAQVPVHYQYAPVSNSQPDEAQIGMLSRQMGQLSADTAHPKVELEGGEASIEEADALQDALDTLNDTKVITTAEFDDTEAGKELVKYTWWTDRIPEKVTTAAELDGGEEVDSELQLLVDKLTEWGRLRMAAAAELNDEPALAQAAALQAKIKSILNGGSETLTSPQLTGGGSGSGGGGGGSPPTAADAGDFEDDEDAARALADEMDKLRDAEAGAGEQAGITADDFLRMAAGTTNGSKAYAYVQAAAIAAKLAMSDLDDETRASTEDWLRMVAGAQSGTAAYAYVKAALAAMGDAETAAAGGAQKVTGAIDDVTKAIPPMVDGLVASTSGWYGLTSELNLFGGILGTVPVWHALIDYLIEFAAVFVPALATMAIGLVAFGVAGYKAFEQVYERVMAVHTAVTATDQSLTPFTGHMTQLENSLRPQVWELYGDAILATKNQTGVFGQIATETADKVDQLGARLVIMMNNGGNGFKNFLALGGADLSKLGEFFDNLGSAFMSFLKVSEETHISQYFLDFFVALSQVLDVIAKLPTPILVVAVALHGLYLWGGLAATVVMKLLDPLRSLALALGAVKAESVAGGLAGLDADSSAWTRLKAGLADINAGFSGLVTRLKSVGTAAKAAAADALSAGEETDAALGGGGASQLVLASETAAGTAAGEAAGESEGKLATEEEGAAEAASGSVFDKLSSAVKKYADSFKTAVGSMVGELVTVPSEADQAAQKVADVTGHSLDEVKAFQQAIADSGQTVQDFATRTTAGQAAVEKYGQGLEGTKAEAVNLAAAMNAPEEHISAVAAAEDGAAEKTGIFSTAMSTLGGTFAKLGLLAIAAAVVYVGVKIAEAKDSTQQWIDSVNQGLGSSSMLTVIGQTMSDLAATTQQLTTSQSLNAQGVHELTGAQTQLSTQLGAELGHVGQIANAYGVSMPQALAMLNAAGVKTSSLFTTQNGVWNEAKEQVAALVQGYAAMGQGMNSLQRDVSVQLVMESSQLKSMQSLNTAWDNFQQLVAAPYSDVLKMAQGFQQFATDAKAAGASMSGLSPASLTLQNDFQASYGDVETLFDAMRNSEAVTGSGGFTSTVKDAVDALIPLAGNNKAAAAEISQLAQEAGGPATTNLSSLAKWAGNVVDPMDKLYSAAQKATEKTSDLDSDAAKLSDTLQSDLDPALASSAFNALGGQKALNAFSTDLLKLGPNSKTTIDAGKQVAQMFLSIDKNSASAKAQFVGWGESMGLTKGQADQLWDEVSKGEKPMQSIQDGLAKSATGADKLGKSLGKEGLLGQIRDLYAQHLDELATFFVKTLPDAVQVSIHGITVGWSSAYESFMRNLGSPVAKFFSTQLPDAAKDVGKYLAGDWDAATKTISVVWNKAFADLGSPVVRAFDSVKKDVTTGFDAWWASHGKELEQIWDTTWSHMEPVFSGIWSGIETAAKFSWGVITGIVTSSWKHITQGLSGGGKAGSQIWDGVVAGAKVAWSEVTTLAQQTWGHIVQVFGGPSKVLWSGIAAAATIAWGLIVASAKIAWDTIAVALKLMWAGAVATAKFAWDTIVAVFSVMLDLMTGNWGKAWDDMKAYATQVWNILKNLGIAVWNDLSQYAQQTWNAIWGFFSRYIISPMDKFFTGTVLGWLTALGRFFASIWSGAWSDFTRFLLDPLDKFLTGTVPGWLSTLGTKIRSTWSTAWSDFQRDLMTPMEKWFSTTLPAAISGSVKTGIDDAINGVNKVIGFINKDVLAHLPGNLSIPLVSKLAAGGVAPSRMASGSVPGTGDEDGTHIIAMGGEYMLRKPARMALEQKFGPNFLNTLNQADTLMGAGSRGNAASQQQPSGRGRYSTGGGILGSIEGFFSGVGSALTSGGKDLAGLVSGGAGALAKLAGEGAKAIFDAVWNSTVSPMVSSLGGNTIPLDVVRAGAADMKTGIDTFLTQQDKQAQSAASSTGGISMSGVTNSSAEAALKAAAAKKGWTGAEWTALYDVEMREAGFSLTAQNPSSGAFGMAQFINGPSEYAQYGGNSSTAAGQAVAMVNYIAQRYGDPEAAWAHEESAGWYAPGGPVGGDGASLFGMAAGGTVMPTGMDEAQAWTWAQSALPAAAAAENNAFWTLNAHHLPANATKDQWGAWYADLGILQTLQKQIYQGSGSSYQAIAGRLSTPTTLTGNQFGVLRSNLVDIHRFINDNPTPPSSYWGYEKNVPWPAGWKNSKGKGPGAISPAAWAAWKYENGLWASASSAMENLYNVTGDAENAWKAMYDLSTGAGTAPPASGTPGVVVTPTGGPTYSVDLGSLISGGPTAPVIPTGGSLSGTGSGFSIAMGGPVGGDGASLAGVAGMFSAGGATPAMAPASSPGFASRMAAGGVAADESSTPRTMGANAVGGGGDRVGVKIGNLHVHNPTPEKPSDSITRSSNRLAFLAGRGAV